MSAMPQRASTPPLAYSREATVYLVLDYQTDLNTLIADLLAGQYRHPLRVVAFDTFDGSTRDVSAEIAREVLSRTNELQLSAAVRDFVKRAGESSWACRRPCIASLHPIHTPLFA